MDNTLLSLLLPPLMLVPVMGLLSRGESSSQLGAELRRKTLHIGAGLLALALPALFERQWPVLACLGLVIAWMIAVRSVACLNRYFGRVLQDAARKSWGEIWFAVSVAFLLLVSDGGGYLYVIPILIMTLADAGAAIAGSCYPVGPLGGLARGKTLAGSAAFLLCAFVVAFAALRITTGMPFGPATAIALCVASLSTIIEAVSSRGTDNFTVPLTAWACLQVLVPAQVGV